MRIAGARSRVLVLLILVSASLVLESRVSSADEQDREFQRRREAAQAALESRMSARQSAGWTPKSKDEQMLTKLTALVRKRERTQDRVATRAVFEAARGEVYLTLARDYIKYGSRYRGYSMRTFSGQYSGYRPVLNYHDYWVLDPWSARLSAHFGEKAARSKGIAAAHEYHANTIYARRLNNIRSRIDTLQREISLKTQLAAGGH